MIKKFINFNFIIHLLLSFTLRILLIIYGIYHDEHSNVPYTDVDYKVFTDAARYIVAGRSPYDRHTYRYSPLLALLLVPNVLIHNVFGKVLFSVMDMLVACLMRLIITSNLKQLEIFANKSYFDLCLSSNCNQQNMKNIGLRHRKKSKHNINKYIKTGCSNTSDKLIKSIATASVLLWLYNPLTVAISTRGNSDSFSGLLVLYTIYLLECKKTYFLTGMLLGISIHFRIYPIIYSLTMFMYLSKFSYYIVKTEKITNFQESKKIKDKENLLIKNENKVIPLDTRKGKKTIFKFEYLYYLIPNYNQILLISGCVLSLSTLTSLFYYIYGYKFIYESYIYHFIRTDPRHNFSVYFYLQYLSAWVKNIGLWQKVLIVLPQLILLLVFSVRYGLNKFTINFAFLIETIIFVIYNQVLTSQYFIWIMVMLPLCVWQLKMTIKTASFLLGIWFAAQAAWLLPAYLLEFQGQNTFFFIWIQGVSFFCANLAITGRLIIHFVPQLQKQSFKVE